MMMVSSLETPVPIVQKRYQRCGYFRRVPAAPIMHFPCSGASALDGHEHHVTPMMSLPELPSGVVR